MPLFKSKRETGVPIAGNSRASAPDHVAGDINDAARRAWVERGAKLWINGNHWRTTAVISLTVSLVLAVAINSMLPLKQVQTIEVVRDENARYKAGGVAGEMVVDEQAKVAWVNDWLRELTEFAPETWERTINRAIGKTVGIGRDQISTFLLQHQHNPASLLSRERFYVREYQRSTINQIEPNRYVVRYSTLSRPAPGKPSETRQYVATLTLQRVPPTTVEAVYANPTGLFVTNLNISEESAK